MRSTKFANAHGEIPQSVASIARRHGVKTVTVIRYFQANDSVSLLQ